MRREGITLDEALRPLAADEGEDELVLPETFQGSEYLPEPDQELEQFEEIATSEEPGEENQDI
jgi:hypothetical protein